MAATKKGKTLRFLFNCCLYTSAVKLNIEWQIVFLAVKTNIDITIWIALLTDLY